MAGRSYHRSANTDNSGSARRHPRIKVLTHQAHRPFLADFSPLATPKELSVSFADVTAKIVDDARATIAMTLQPGRYELSVFADEPLPAEVPEGCSGHLMLVVSAPEEAASEERMLTSVELAFDQPIVLHNVFAILARLQSRFRDYEVTALVNRLTQAVADRTGITDLHTFGRALAGRLGARITDWIPPAWKHDGFLDELKGAARNTMLQAATVRLSRISAQPIRTDGRWRLELRFTGEWELAGQTRFPFHHIAVHRAILPAPHALLESLFSAQPLATADLHQDQSPVSAVADLPSLELAQQLGMMLSSLKGKVQAKLRFPDLSLKAHLADDGILSVDTQNHGIVELKAGFNGTVEPHRMHLHITRLQTSFGKDTLSGNGSFTGWVGTEDRHPASESAGTEDRQPGFADTAIGRCLESLISGEWSSEKLSFKIVAEVADGSRIGGFSSSIHYKHPHLTGSNNYEIEAQDLALSGTLTGRFGTAAAGKPAHSLAIYWGANISLVEGTVLDDGKNRVFPRISGTRMAGAVRNSAPQEHELTVAGKVPFTIHSITPVDAFPELNINDSELITHASGIAEITGISTLRERGKSPFEANFTGSQLKLTLEKADALLDGRRITVPPDSRFEIAVTEGILAASGLGKARLNLHWDLKNQSPVLQHEDALVQLFVPQLCLGDLILHISPAGGVSISGEESGLYDARYFNALLNPAQDIQRLTDILGSDEAIDRVFATLEAFSPEAVDWLRRLHSFIRRMQKVIEEDNIEQVADVIPSATIARLLARIVFADGDVEADLLPVVKQVIAAQGLDVVSIKQLISKHFPNHEYEFEVDRVLRLISRLVTPKGPLPPFPLRKAKPLAEDPLYHERYQHWPTAATLYKRLSDPTPLSPEWSALIAHIAPYLNLAQVGYILKCGRTDWQPDDHARLRHIKELKRRVKNIYGGYGGVAFAPQAVTISFFLADTIRMSRIAREESRPKPAGLEGAVNLRTHADIPACFLGPRDVAILLHAGLASAWSGRAVQLNLRMLVELVLDMPPTYLRDVLIELGGNDPHVLTAALNALLDMPQGAMKKRLDLVTAFSKAMGFKFPRLSDYLAGGRHARHSYFQALATTADQILDLAEPYRALEYYLQEHRHRPPSFPRRISRRKALLAKTASAIGKADSRGTACKFSGRSHSRHRQAQRAYFDAFSACQDLLEDTPLAFQWDTIRSFWARNYEALVVLSVVRNIQQSVDNIRFWFEKLIERPIPDAEQTLVETVINALFHLPQDRQEMLQDPLVRLLIDPPEGTYDFTVISCMGVITGGARGTELEEAYQRLLTTRGIHTIRADTATARALNFNAQRIIEAIRKVDTPWGYIGYSQGCPNGLMAEAMLMAGPPDQRQLLDGLVARNLLYSAFNASSHGTLGAEKFLDTMVYLDHFLAHYQARFSSRAIRSVLRTIRLTMDSQGMMLGLAGSRSLTAWGVLPLHKGGQFKIVPTSTVRGIVEKATLPESLEFLSNVLTIQTEGDTHDSQVSILEAQGHSLLASTPAMDLLRRCDMGSRVLRTHHWAPLNKDVNFVTTRRDRDQGIYDGPKDRHVFPWIEVNARFGRIKHKDL